MTGRAAGWTCALLLWTAPAFAQSSTNQDRVQPDRPDVTNGAQLVAPGRVQLESGGTYTKASRTVSGFGSPVLARLGVSDWFEARLGTDGWVTRADDGRRNSGFGNVQAGAKLRLISDATGTPVLSVLPTINLPTASANKGLGSGDVDYTVTLVGGVDIGARGHIDANYGAGRIGAGGGQAHFSQHLVSVSASLSVARWDPYAELFWFSEQEPRGGAVGAFDVGTICHLRDRVALDGGLQVGLSHAAPNLSLFAGLSFDFKRAAQ